MILSSLASKLDSANVVLVLFFAWSESWRESSDNLAWNIARFWISITLIVEVGDVQQRGAAHITELAKLLFCW